MPNYPLPVLKLTRLGVKTEYQGSGVGRVLLKHVLMLALKQKERVGCFGVVVDAEEEAVEYYKKFGFITLEAVAKTETVPMFLAVKTIEKSQTL